MQDQRTVIEFTEFSERDLITRLVSSFFILDYGFIGKVNADGTVNVTHAKRPQTMEGVELPETRTNNLELLTLSGGGFSIKWESRRPSGLRKTRHIINSLAHRTTWLRSDFQRPGLTTWNF